MLIIKYKKCARNYYNNYLYANPIKFMGIQLPNPNKAIYIFKKYSTKLNYRFIFYPKLSIFPRISPKILFYDI